MLCSTFPVCVLQVPLVFISPVVTDNTAFSTYARMLRPCEILASLCCWQTPKWKICTDNQIWSNSCLILANATSSIVKTIQFKDEFKVSKPLNNQAHFHRIDLMTVGAISLLRSQPSASVGYRDNPSLAQRRHMKVKLLHKTSKLSSYSKETTKICW